jgi:hypothetical protein
MINARAEPGLPHIQRLVDTLLDLVLTSEYDLAAQARWGGLLHRLLRVYRRKLTLQVPWRPFYDMLRRQALEPSANYEGERASADGGRRLRGRSSPAAREHPPSPAAYVSDQKKQAPTQHPRVSSPPPHAGAGVCEARRRALVQVVHRSRRFFPPGSAAQIWAEFGPALRDQTTPNCFEALG